MPIGQVECCILFFFELTIFGYKERKILIEIVFMQWFQDFDLK